MDYRYGDVVNRTNSLSCWRCNNFAYLDLYLNKFYKGVDFENPIEEIKVCDNVIRCSYAPQNRRLYKMLTTEGVEFFDQNTWTLHRVTADFNKIECKNFHIFLEKEEALTEYPTVVFFDRHIDFIAEIFRIDCFDKLDIYILPEEYIMQLFKTNDISGFFDPLKGKIYVNAWDIHLTHEIVHALMNTWRMWPNLFCQEGIAEAFSYPICIPHSQMEKISCFKDVFFSWHDLNKERYAIGGFFFRYLLEFFGGETVKHICILSQGEGEDGTEHIIKNATKNEHIVKEFVRWFLHKNWEVENWFTPDWSY